MAESGLPIFVLGEPFLPLTDTKPAVFVLGEPFFPPTDTKPAVFVLGVPFSPPTDTKPPIFVLGGRSLPYLFLLRNAACNGMQGGFCFAEMFFTSFYLGRKAENRP